MSSSFFFTVRTSVHWACEREQVHAELLHILISIQTAFLSLIHTHTHTHNAFFHLPVISCSSLQTVALHFILKYRFLIYNINQSTAGLFHSPVHWAALSNRYLVLKEFRDIFFFLPFHINITNTHAPINSNLSVKINKTI